VSSFIAYVCRLVKYCFGVTDEEKSDRNDNKDREVRRKLT